jgi:hypothetical protein
MKFKCARCGKEFPTQRALVIDCEVKREDGVLATFTPDKAEEQPKCD